MTGALPAGIAFGSSLGEMRLVRGNAAAPYVFGGRVDELEAEACRAAGLPAYTPLSTPRSWRIDYPRRTIDDFYVDVDEVNVVEFLAFLDAAAGYPDARHWPGGRAGTRERLTELRRSLAARGPGEAAVGVTWDEASAYARWAGKRLPSIVEWEYAVRGGSDYRVHAGSAGAANGAVRDVTPDTGLARLCGGVSEWTATPGWSPTAGDLLARLRADPLSILRSEAAAQAASDSFWIAGAEDGAVRSDFSVIDRRARGWNGETVGFRCAMTAADAQRRLENASTDRWRIRGGTELP
jgi:formylglycine-generating enzyme required for sulfatase activity